MSNKKTLLILAAVTLMLATGGAVALWPEDTPAEDTGIAQDGDTGMSRFQTEELMRTIGYVQ